MSAQRGNTLPPERISPTVPGPAYPSLELELRSQRMLPTMLVPRELNYLAWLASRCTGVGRVVELGPFLGGSTDALLDGLARSDTDHAPILSYDAFRVPTTMDELTASIYARYELEPGDSFRAHFEQNLGANASRVVVREGLIPETHDEDTLKRLYPEAEPIELLFCDVAKTWEVHRTVLHAFATHLRPGSVLVQQDFMDLQTPWIPLHMWQLREALEPLDAIHRTPTVSFSCTGSIAPLLGTLWDESYARSHPEEIESAWERVIAYWSDLIGPDAAGVFHGHAFRLATMHGRWTDAVRHGRAYERWSRVRESRHTYFSGCWPMLLQHTGEQALASDAGHDLIALAAGTIAVGERTDRTVAGRDRRHVDPEVRRVFWDRIIARMRQQPACSIYLYGAGLHTRWLFSAYAGAITQLIAGVIDDAPSCDELGGVPVIATDRFTPDANGPIVIYPSSDAHEQTMLAALSQRFSDEPGVRIERVYTHASMSSIPREIGEYHIEPIPEASRAPTKAIDPREADLLGLQCAHREELGLGMKRQWRESLLSLHRVPEWCQGYLHLHEAAFVWDLIEATRPRTVVEIGTASGVSSALLIGAFEAMGLDDATLHSFDIATTCYFDDTRTLGAAVGEMTPHLLDRVRAHARMDAADASRRFRAGEIDLLFIDAEHAQPAPTIDLLSLIHAARPGSWVVLHDIELHRITTADPGIDFSCVSGAGRLFDSWPFGRLQPWGELPQERNIGAIRLPEEPWDAVAHLLTLLDAPWEASGSVVERARRARAMLDRVHAQALSAGD